MSTRVNFHTASSEDASFPCFWVILEVYWRVPIVEKEMMSLCDSLRHMHRIHNSRFGRPKSEHDYGWNRTVGEKIVS
jgi:hypothetical protein